MTIRNLPYSNIEKSFTKILKEDTLSSEIKMIVKNQKLSRLKKMLDKVKNTNR